MPMSLPDVHVSADKVQHSKVQKSLSLPRGKVSSLGSMGVDSDGISPFPGFSSDSSTTVAGASHSFAGWVELSGFISW